MKILIRKQKAGKWQVVESSGYSGEADLQKLLAESPSLVSIEEIRGDASPLVAAVREVGLPGSGNTDVMAFSASGDIVVVECKLAANQEIKRKVIAQVLEYGAYLWKMGYEELDRRITGRTGKSLAELVREAVEDPEWDEEGFRATVEDRLERGAFILVIAVDEMNEELSRTIRFINTCGNPEFSFTALEMNRYKKDEVEILVPHLFSGDAKPREEKGAGLRKSWTEEQFLKASKETVQAEVFEMILNLYRWAKERANRIAYGTGTKTGSFTFHSKKASVFSLYTNGTLVVNYGAINQYVSAQVAQTFQSDISQIPTFAHLSEDVKKWPSIPIEDAFGENPEFMEMFKKAVVRVREVIEGMG